MPTPNPLEKVAYWLKTSITIRLITIGFLVLILLIPISFINSIISERKYRKADVVREISAKWGEAQTVSGPIITIPYKSVSRVYNNETKIYDLVSQRKYAHFLPEKLDIKTTIFPEIKYRNIYEAIVYTAEVEISGSFKFPESKKLNIEESLLFKQAFLSTGLSDLRNIEAVELNFAGQTYDFETGLETHDIIRTGISTKINLNKDSLPQEIPFSFKLKFNGSKSLNFLPLGKETKVNVKSSSPNPKFFGAFLPKNKTISASGFSADWSVIHLNRNYPQQFTGSQVDIPDSAFGVELLVGVDEYQKNTRASKYAVLFILLTFMTFFFVQILNKISIHPMQYLLVGFALTIFYVLLISISEHLRFAYSYLIASSAIILQITLYASTIFKNRKLTTILGLILVILYGFIFTIIQLQGYALLAGAIGLFIVLAAAMYVSRNIDWYSLKSKEKEKH